MNGNKLSKAIKKVSADISNMSQEEFEKELKKHSDGDITKLMNEVFK